MLRVCLLFALTAGLSGCQPPNQPDVTGVYSYRLFPGEQAPPMGQLVLSREQAIYKTPMSEFTLAYTVEHDTVYLRVDERTRLAFQRVHRDTLRSSLGGVLGALNYVREHE